MKKALLVAVLLGVAASQVSAATYTYTGNNYNAFEGLGPNPFDTSMSVSGSFEVNSAFGSSMPLTEFSPLSFSFFDGVDTFTSSDSLAFTLFSVATNALGEISSWEIVISAGPTSLTTKLLPSLIMDGGTANNSSFVYARSENQAGTWQVRDVSAVPIPAALPLLAAGLGAMGFMGWRRKRKTVA